MCIGSFAPARGPRPKPAILPQGNMPTLTGHPVDCAPMNSGNEGLRREIAATAARMIADGGLDYGSARSKAALAVCGTRTPRGAMPDNDDIDEALREHLGLFDADHQARVDRMRAVAADLMARLEGFHPLVTGSVWKGIVTEHAPIHLQLFHDNGKEVHYWLLDQGIGYESATIPHFRSQGEVEVLGLTWRGEPVMLSLYRSDDLRGALRAPAGGETPRGDRAALLARMEESQ